MTYRSLHHLVIVILQCQTTYHKISEQAGAELCQAQVKLGVIVDVVE